MKGGGELSNADHFLAFREERHYRKKNWDDPNGAKLKGLVRYLDSTNRCLILHAKRTGACINVQDTTVTGIVLTATEFRDFYAHVMILTPLNFRENLVAVPHPLM